MNSLSDLKPEPRMADSVNAGRERHNFRFGSWPRLLVTFQTFSFL